MNYLAILVSVVVTFVTSAVWYIAFSGPYFRLLGLDPEDPAATAMSVWDFVIVLARHLVVALVISYLVKGLGIVGLKEAMGIGLLLWVGFPLVLLVGSVVNDKVPVALAAIHGGDWLVKILIMTAILTLWRR